MAKGFTLIELITVIVVLAIVASMGTGFIASSMESYNRTQQRAKLINRGRQALEQMTRQLRGALPFSLRTSNAGACLEYLPVAAGASYLNEVPDLANGAADDGNSNPIDTAPYTVEFGTARYAAIGALNASEIYGAGPVSLMNLDAIMPFATVANDVTLGSDFSWRRNSIRQRVYLTDFPSAFCVEGTDLRNYVGFDTGFPINNNVTLDGSGVLMAQNVAAVATLFVIASGTEDRNTTVAINISFQEGGETVSFTQEVAIRNVP